MKYFSILIFYILCYYQSDAQTKLGVIDFNVSVSDIEVGDPIQHTITITTKQPNVFVIFPKLDEYYYKSFSIVKIGVIDTSESNGTTVYSQTNIITGFDSGVYKLPQIDASLIQDDSSEKVSVATTPIRVRNVPVNLLGDIKDIYQEKNQPEYWQKFLIGLSCIVLLFMLYKLIKYLKQKHNAQHKATPLTAIERANLYLKQATKDVEQNNFKEAITNSTKAFKYYIEERFGIKILDKTTTDFMESINHHHVLNNSKTDFATWLNRADMLKFAKADASATILLNDIEAIRMLIQQWENQIKQQENTHVGK
jgi:hypothetical protein